MIIAPMLGVMFTLFVAMNGVVYCQQPLRMPQTPLSSWTE